LLLNLIGLNLFSFSMRHNVEQEQDNILAASCRVTSNRCVTGMVGVATVDVVVVVLRRRAGIMHLRATYRSLTEGRPGCPCPRKPIYIDRGPVLRR
jgi:hypothetical protein